MRNLYGAAAPGSAAKVSRSKKKYSFSNKKTRRRRTRTFALAAFLVLVAAVAAYANVYATRDDPPKKTTELVDPKPYHRLTFQPDTARIGAPNPPDLTLSGVAYESIAAELAGAEPNDVAHVRGSILNPEWASARIPVPGRDDGSYYAVFLQESDKKWTARRSVLMEDQEFPRDVRAVLGGVPEDLVNPLFPEDKSPDPAKDLKERALQEIRLSTNRRDGWKTEDPKDSGEFHTVRVEDSKDKDSNITVYLRDNKNAAPEIVATGRNLTVVEAPGFPKELAKTGVGAAPEEAALGSDEVVVEGDARPDDQGLEEVRRVVEGYPGEVGFYALDLESEGGFGARTDEVFFSASTIKIPVMVAVYRKIESGEIEYSDTFETKEEDWAAGAGWLRWDTPGATTTVEDSLWLMITQSDNVATNSLVRLVGGPDYVNEVARDLGAKDTALHWKLSSERAAVPSLDNRTTPRDMATMLTKIHKKQAAREFASKEMLGLLEQNQLEYWMEAGVPQGVPVANKAGWLDATYNDAGIVEFDGHPYVLAAFTKYGPEKIENGQPTLQALSKAVWQAETGKTVQKYEKQQKEKDQPDGKDDEPETKDKPDS